MEFVIPKNAVSHFHLRPGDRVTDFGAGSGHFSFAMADVVAPDGRVTAIEIQKSLAERVAREARDKKINNLEIMWADLESSKGVRIAEGTQDATLIANTLFQIRDKVHVLLEMRRTLRDGGKLIIIDWTDPFNGLGPARGHVVTEQEARQLAESCGFTFERSFPTGTHHYGIALRKK